jgi:hypothetical protein
LIFLNFEFELNFVQVARLQPVDGQPDYSDRINQIRNAYTENLSTGLSMQKEAVNVLQKYLEDLLAQFMFEMDSMYNQMMENLPNPPSVQPGGEHHPKSESEAEYQRPSGLGSRYTETVYLGAGRELPVHGLFNIVNNAEDAYGRRHPVTLSDLIGTPTANFQSGQVPNKDDA